MRRRPTGFSGPTSRSVIRRQPEDAPWVAQRIIHDAIDILVEQISLLETREMKLFVVQLWFL